jgi:hypothetical protein
MQQKRIEELDPKEKGKAAEIRKIIFRAKTWKIKASETS